MGRERDSRHRSTREGRGEEAARPAAYKRVFECRVTVPAHLRRSLIEWFSLQARPAELLAETKKSKYVKDPSSHHVSIPDWDRWQCRLLILLQPVIIISLSNL
jgi:hypothetical protein